MGYHSLVQMAGYSWCNYITIADICNAYSATGLYSRGLEKRAKCVLEGLRRNGENVLEECTAIQAALCRCSTI